MSALDRVLWLVQFPGMDLQYSAPPLITAWASVIFSPLLWLLWTLVWFPSQTLLFNFLQTDSGAARFSPGI